MPHNHQPQRTKTNQALAYPSAGAQQPTAHALTKPLSWPHPSLITSPSPHSGGQAAMTQPRLSMYIQHSSAGIPLMYPPSHDSQFEVPPSMVAGSLLHPIHNKSIPQHNPPASLPSSTIASCPPYPRTPPLNLIRTPQTPAITLPLRLLFLSPGLLLSPGVPTSVLISKNRLKYIRAGDPPAPVPPILWPAQTASACSKVQRLPLPA